MGGVGSVGPGRLSTCCVPSALPGGRQQRYPLMGEVTGIRAWFSAMHAVSKGGMQLRLGPGQGRLPGGGDIHPVS